MLNKNLLFFAFISVLICACAAAAEGPRLTLENTTWDFGLIDRSQPAVKELTITNSGDAPLIIDRMFTDCDCLSYELKRSTIPAYGYSVLKIFYDPGGKPPGEDITSLSILSNDGQEAETITFYATISSDKSSFEKYPSVPSMTSKELKSLIGAGKTPVLLDVRSRPSFLVRHIPGALSFPRKLFDRKDPLTEKTLSSIGKDDLVVVYCGTGYNSSFVAEELINRGYKAVNLDGISRWTNLGYPVSAAAGPDADMSKGEK